MDSTSCQAKILIFFIWLPASKTQLDCPKNQLIAILKNSTWPPKKSIDCQPQKNINMIFRQKISDKLQNLAFFS